MSKQIIKEYDDLKKILKSSDGKELYSHLIECFNNLILYYPDEALDKIEEISYLLKSSDKTLIRKFLNLDNPKDTSTLTSAMQPYLSKIQALFPPKPEEGGDPDEAPEPSTAGKLSDLFKDSQVLQWAGVGFGEEETFRLQSGLTKLSVRSGSEKIRFWGKIYGTMSDYYVAEGFVAGGDEEEGEKPKGFEDRGSGVNEFVYWVANNSLGEWTMLPDVTPEFLKATRDIKVKFTGDLNRKIITNPFFYGEERYYLRAQIARITHSTTIMPKGLHKLAEDNPKEIELIEFEDEAKAYVPTTETQTKLGNWVYAKKSILK
jgi:radial spoke head protein 4/6